MISAFIEQLEVCLPDVQDAFSHAEKKILSKKQEKSYCIVFTCI